MRVGRPVSGLIKPVNRPRLDLSHPINRNIIGCWLLGSQNTFLDLSPFGSIGTASNGPISLVANGRSGLANSFNGTSQSVHFANDIGALKIVGPFFVMARFKLSTTAGLPSIFQCYSQPGITPAGYELGINTANTTAHQLTILTGNAGGGFSATGSGSTDDDGNWHVGIGGAIDNSLQNVWVDGHAGTPAASNATVYSSPTYVRIGAESAGGTDGKFWSGQIDIVRVYNRAPTQLDANIFYADPYIGIIEDSAATIPAWPVGSSAPVIITNKLRQFWTY